MSDFGDALRELLEPELVCRCGERNSPTFRIIRVDINGVAYCRSCGRGGPYQIFQSPKEQQA